MKNEATARVIMAKKIALTRSESRPIASARAADVATASAEPSARLPPVAPSFAAAMPMP